MVLFYLNMVHVNKSKILSVCTDAGVALVLIKLRKYNLTTAPRFDASTTRRQVTLDNILNDCPNESAKNFSHR